MKKIAAVLVLLSLVSCKEKPKVSPEARGAAFFAPTAEKFGELVLADLKAKKPGWYKDYLKESGAKTDAELLQKMQIGKGILDQFPGGFALTEAQESALKAGRFADEENRKKVKAAAARFDDGHGHEMPDAPRIAIQKVESGEWGKGVELEFLARMLDASSARMAH
jgi:hypothetical protein